MLSTCFVEKDQNVTRFTGSCRCRIEDATVSFHVLVVSFIVILSSLERLENYYDFQVDSKLGQFNSLFLCNCIASCQ